jgi:hypothetical protein
MKLALAVLLALSGTSFCAHAQDDVPNDATHLGLRVFVYTAFAGVNKIDQMPKFPSGRKFTRTDLYRGVAAGIRIRGKQCANVAQAHAADVGGERVDVRCTDGGRYRLLSVSGEVQNG